MILMTDFCEMSSCDDCYCEMPGSLEMVTLKCCAMKIFYEMSSCAEMILWNVKLCGNDFCEISMHCGDNLLKWQSWQWFVCNGKLFSGENKKTLI